MGCRVFFCVLVSEALTLCCSFSHAFLVQFLFPVLISPIGLSTSSTVQLLSSPLPATRLLHIPFSATLHYCCGTRAYMNRRKQPTAFLSSSTRRSSITLQ